LLLLGTATADYYRSTSLPKGLHPGLLKSESPD